MIYGLIKRFKHYYLQKNNLFLKSLVCIFFISLLQGCSRMPTPNFQQMTLPNAPNHYLICPKNYCNVIPNAFSPVYPVSADDLFNAFNHIVVQEPRVNFIYSMPEQGQFQLVARSRILQFPDDIAVQFIALTGSTSTLAIYSKSRYGYYDFGVNKRRLEGWLSQLNQMISQSAQK